MNAKKIGLIALFSALLLCITTAPAMADDFWVSDSDIVSGLGDVIWDSAPTAFNKGGTWYLISGDFYGTFNGYKWAGSAWQSDSAVVSGLGDVGSYSKPAVFNKDDTWYLIAGEYHGGFYGYKWTGSAWESDPAMVSGLGDVGDRSTLTAAFYKDATWYLIAGGHNGGFYGYKWTGSAWESDPTIVSGLSDVGSDSAPTIYYKDGIWHLIVGEHNGGFYGYKWTGSAWESDPAMVSGLGDIGTDAAPDVFYKNATRYLIAGEMHGVFNGYRFLEFYGVSVTMDKKYQKIFPGENTSYTVIVKNTGNIIASYEVTMSGTAVDEPTITVSPLNWNTGSLTPSSESVTIVNISTSDATPKQTYTLTASAICDQDSNVNDSVTSELEVAVTIVPDFVVGNLIGKVELFESTDDGFSSQGIITDTGDQAWGLTSDDYNGDGYRDFIVGDYDGQLELFLGHGLTSAGIIADVGAEAYGLTSGDYDNDGYADFIVGDSAGELELFLNDGTGAGAGGFNSAGLIADIGLHAWGLTSCDFDGDSDTDFIAGDYDGTVKLFKNNGSGGFTSTTIGDIGSEAYGVTSGDYDGDGDCDFLATADNGEVKLFKNQGDGSFTNCGTVISLGYWGFGLESNDFDDDGDVDVLGQTSTDKVNLYKNDGTGNFAFDSMVADPGIQPRGLTSGNFVMPDLIVTSITTPIIHAGVSNIITATIENTGNEDAAELKTALYADGDANPVDTKLVPLLNVSDSTEVSFSWTPVDAGSYTLRVMADPFNLIAESIEANNNKTKAVTAEEAVLPPPIPFIIKYGYVFYENGTACNGPVVNVTNLDTNVTWQAETYASSHYYELVLDSYDLSANDVLEFNASDPDATQKNVTDYSVTQAELNDGGIFGLNLTLHPVGEEVVNNVTTADIEVKGTVSGTHENTHDSDNVYEAIEEVESKGKPASRYSCLEHKWTIDVISGTKTSVTFHVEAYRADSGENDKFNFSYSTNDVDYTDMVTVTKMVDDNISQTYELPNTLSGTVYIRVTDTDQTAGRKTLDTISIDHIFIRSVLGASEPDTTPPAAVEDLAASDPTSSSITLTWTAPGDDGNTGTANSYDIRYSTSTITDANWGSATQCTDETAPQPAGSSETFTVTGLDASTTYYFALKTSDEVPNESPLSNVASNTTTEAAADQMHVASIDMSLKTAGPNTNAIALVTIVNATGVPVGGATVHGYWSNATTDIDSGTTDASGQVSLNSDKVKSASGKTFTFTVDDVAKTGWAWDGIEKSNSTIVP